MLVYVADDDQDICYVIESQFKADGYSVQSFLNGQDLLTAFIETPCDLIVTDVMMPVLTGFELCRKIRELSEVPIVIISANGEEEKKLRGYELGSDDYLTKPFSLKELSSKTKNMLHRYRLMKTKLEDNNSIRISDFTLLKREHQVYIKDEIVILSEKEFQFVLLLAENPNNALSREFIIEHIWGYESLEDTRLLDHVVKRIRKKLIALNSDFKIETVWGYGYKVSE